MAKIEMAGLDDYRAKLMSLGANIEGVCKEAVYPAAGMVIEAIKENTPVDSPEDANNLRNSAALKNFENDDGYIYTAVYFSGYDENGTPNPVKARVLESGSSTRRKHPFIRPAVNSIRQAALIEIEKNFNAICERKMAEKGGN